MTHKFFVPPDQIKENIIAIKGSDVNQIRLVLRMTPGDTIEVLDGSGKIYATKIKIINKDSVEAEIITSRCAKSESKIKVALLQSISRESKMDFIIQKCTELGISRIIPVISERTIVKLDENKQKKRIERWNKITKEASEQSGRGIIPKIDMISKFSEAINIAKEFDLSLIPWEMEEKTSLKETLKQNKEVKSILIAIGPEGGFSKSEISEAVKSGLKPVTLGKRILRTETAGIATLTMINYEYEI